MGVKRGIGIFIFIIVIILLILIYLESIGIKSLSYIMKF